MTSYVDREDIEHKRLIQAEQAAVKTRQLRPVIKEELRLKILSSRHAQGKPELENLFEKPKSYDLTREEEEKRERRRAQNREAAKRCREKRKQIQRTIDEEYDDECRKKIRIEEEVKDLQNQVSKMETFLTAHVKSGSCLQPHVVNHAPSQVDSFTQDLSNCKLEELDQLPEELTNEYENQNMSMSASSHSGSHNGSPTQDISDSLFGLESTFLQYSLSQDLISSQYTDTPSEPTEGSLRLPGMDSFVKINSYISL